MNELIYGAKVDWAKNELGRLIDAIQLASVSTLDLQGLGAYFAVSSPAELSAKAESEKVDIFDDEFDFGSVHQDIFNLRSGLTSDLAAAMVAAVSEDDVSGSEQNHSGGQITSAVEATTASDDQISFVDTEISKTNTTIGELGEDKTSFNKI